MKKTKKFISAKGAIEKRINKMIKRFHARGVKVEVELERLYEIIGKEHFIVHINEEKFYAYGTYGKIDSEKVFDYNVAYHVVAALYYPYDRKN